MNLDLWSDDARRAYFDYRHYRQSQDLGALRRAIAGLRTAIQDASAADLLRADYQAMLAVALYSEHKWTERPADLDEVISLQAQASEAASAGSPERLTRMQNLVGALRTRWDLARDLADLDWAIDLTRTAFNEAPHGHPGRIELLSMLGQQFTDRHGQTNDVADIDEAITALSAALAAAPASAPDRLHRIAILSAALGRRWFQTHDLADLNQVIALYRTMTTEGPDGHPGRGYVLKLLGHFLMSRHGQTNDVADIDEAITALSAALAAAPASDPDRLHRMQLLSAARATRFDLTRNLADLDEAIGLSRTTITEASDGHSGRLEFLAALGRQLMHRYSQTNSTTDLYEAISALSDAVEAAPADHPDRLWMLDEYASALAGRFWRTRQQADVEAAITALRAAVVLAPPGHDRRAQQLANLGAALEGRFWLTGDPRDIDESIGLLTEALAIVPDGHRHRPAMLNNRSVSLLARYSSTGEMRDLDEAVAASRAAVAATAPTDAIRRSAHLSVLSSCLISRYVEGGHQAADLAGATAAAREAVALSPAGDTDRPRLQTNLAGILLCGSANMDAESLDEAVSLLSEAIDATPPEDARRTDQMINLGRALEARYDLTGSEDDLDRAIATGQKAAEGEITVLSARITAMSNLATYLVKRYIRTERAVDLDVAIGALRAAVDVTPADHPDRAASLTELGMMLFTRHESKGVPEDRNEAFGALRAGAMTTTAPPGRRMVAARAWWSYALLIPDPGEALAAFSLAVELLPMTAWHGLDQASREERLREWSGLACEAATIAVAAGQPERAVELLEAGRSVLWTQALSLRQDTSEIRQRAPELAALLDSSRDILNEPAAARPIIHTVTQFGAAGPEAPVLPSRTTAEQRTLEQKRRAAHDWDTAVTSIRQLAGFENFLRPVPLAELRLAASHGPVAIVNISSQGSHALIITPPSAPASALPTDPPVLVVDLPNADAHAVLSRANTLLNAIGRNGDPDAGLMQREQDRHAVFSVLDWTWDTVAEPVLAALGYTGPARGPLESWPRLWWCPTGPASVLPLHAAGVFPRSQGQYAAMGETAASVTGRAVSSYCTTLATLIRSRNRPAGDTSATAAATQLAVGVPAVPAYAADASPLPAIPAEFEVLRGHMPVPGRAAHLVSPEATTGAVSEALPGHSWLHLSCHAFQHPVDAARSAFLLDDEPLTLANLVALDLQNKDLAYLAACQTATGDLRLLDESLHLAAALQLVGYRHVLATLWSISDAAAPEMAETIYAYLTGAGHQHPRPADEPSASRAPYALHHAATRLRQAVPADPLLWAPYVHLGP